MRLRAHLGTTTKLRDTSTRNAELDSISIRENARTLRKFPDRGCCEAQPQRLARAEPLESSRPIVWVTRCGWSSGHSRGPLISAPPRCATVSVPRCGLRLNVND